MPARPPAARAPRQTRSDLGHRAPRVRSTHRAARTTEWWWRTAWRRRCARWRRRRSPWRRRSRRGCPLLRGGTRAANRPKATRDRDAGRRTRQRAPRAPAPRWRRRGCEARQGWRRAASATHPPLGPAGGGSRQRKRVRCTLCHRVLPLPLACCPASFTRCSCFVLIAVEVGVNSDRKLPSRPLPEISQTGRSCSSCADHNSYVPSG